jgi:hypothetical protein
LLELIVGFGQFFVLAAKGEAGRAVFYTVLHFGQHEPQVFDFPLQMTAISVLDTAVFLPVDLLPALIFLVNEQF